MGPQQLSGVMDIIKREALIKAKQPGRREKLATARIALETRSSASQIVILRPPGVG